MGSTASAKKKTFKNYVNWFEIPAINIQRAVAFYNHIYVLNMEIVESESYAMAFFPANGGIGGAIVAGSGCIPSETGSLVYLNGGEDLGPTLEKIEEAGGRVILPKTLINEESGYFAIFIDTEGNRLALHSKK